MREFAFSVHASDCQWHYFTVSGHGGGGKDTSNTGVRVVHPPSGAVGIGRDERSQRRNRVAAFRRMAKTPAFQAWARMAARGLTSVENDMTPDKLKVEQFDGTRWVPFAKEAT
jgi:protein subunit release factor A